MSEYWVSKKKYFCKYCEIYIADDAPSRQHHESGLRHKGNKERFVRSLYKQGEKRKKESEEERREMERVDRAAMAAYAQDVAGGRAKASSTATTSSSAPSASSSQKLTKPTNPWANYSTAASLGYTDPDAERLKAEEEARRSMGTVGTWEVIGTNEDASTSASAVQGRPDHPEDTRTHKLKKKKMTVGLGEIYDPGIIKIKPRVKQEDQDNVKEEGKETMPKREEEAEVMIPKKEEESDVQISKTEEVGTLSGQGLKGKWKTTSWAAAASSSGPAPKAPAAMTTQLVPLPVGDNPMESVGESAPSGETGILGVSEGNQEDEQGAKNEEQAGDMNGLFRKRKRTKLA